MNNKNWQDIQVLTFTGWWQYQCGCMVTDLRSVVLCRVHIPVTYIENENFFKCQYWWCVGIKYNTQEPGCWRSHCTFLLTSWLAGRIYGSRAQQGCNLHLWQQGPAGLQPTQLCFTHVVAQEHDSCFLLGNICGGGERLQHQYLLNPERQCTSEVNVCPIIIWHTVAYICGSAGQHSKYDTW